MKRASLYLFLIFMLVSTACVIGGTAATSTPTAAPPPPATATAISIPTETIAPLPSTPEPIATMPVLEEPTLEPALEATAEPTVELAPQPTMAPEAPSTPGVYREEFTDVNQLNDWQYLYVTGNTQQNAKFSVVNDTLKVTLPIHEETDLKIYNVTKSYSDMIVTAEVDNLGDSNNGVGVICRVTEKGWYEFRISSSGLYAIYRYDAALKKAKQPPYVQLAEGGTPLVHTGKKTNTISMNCSGSDFSFMINNQPLKTNITPTLKSEFAKYPEGGYGVTAVTYNNTNSRVEVNFNWLELDAIGAEAGQPAVQPTQAVSNGGGDFYREDFKTVDDIASWKYLYVTGNNQGKAKFGVTDEKFTVYLPAREETHLKVYNVDKTYTDVGIQAEVENLGNNTNGVSLLCRVSEKGWYEFRISSSGLYAIYRYDPVLKNQHQNPYVFIEEGGSPLIHAGRKINTIAMNCKGSNFTFAINGEQLKTNISTTLKDEFSKLPQGGFGLGVWSYAESGSAVEVNFNWIETYQPQ
jgi:hypothetical protein